ncbi:MAG: amidase [Scrofimicrobium sp.]
MGELHDYSAVELREMLGNREVSPTELTRHYLERITQLNPALHALTTLTPDRALERAKSLESNETVPDRLDQPLWGLPFADKDLDDRAGVRSTYGSVAMTGYVAQSSSPVVEDMDRAGGISLGKTNVPEFGSPCYAVNRLPEGYARNPWDPSLDPGGSSSGAAVAVSARMLPIAPGNDAGGSIRIPAAATGLVGLKPSRGRVPGLPGAGSLAGLPTAGPLGRTVGDAALLLDGMLKGPHRYALRAPNPPYMAENGSFLDAADLPVPRLRIGWNTWSPWAEEYDITVDPQIIRVFEETLQLLSDLGHRVEAVQPTAAPGYVQAFRAVWMGSAAAVPLPDEALEIVEPLTAWLIRCGRECPASDLPTGLTRLAQFESQIISDYSNFDAVLTPGLAMTPRPPDWYDQMDGNLNFIQQCQYTPFTSYLNVAGLPAIALPVGQGTSEITGAVVPIGVQAIGRPGDEATLLRLGRQLEEVLNWSDREPEMAK